MAFEQRSAIARDGHSKTMGRKIVKGREEKCQNPPSISLADRVRAH
jgi:hypothetical protein